MHLDKYKGRQVNRTMNAKKKNCKKKKATQNGKIKV